MDRQQSSKVPGWGGRAAAWFPVAILSTPWSLEKPRLALPVPFLPCWASFSFDRTEEGRRRWGEHLGTSVSKSLCTQAGRQ